MYLSCLLVDVGDNPDRPRPGRRWLRNPYHVHQRLCMAFPSAERTKADPQFLKPWAPADFPEQRHLADRPLGEVERDVLRQVHAQRDRSGGFLFRIDARPGGRVMILVQSAVKPDWDYAFRNADHLLAAPPQAKRCDPRFAEGQRLRFRLVANPTIRRVFGGPAPEGQPKQSGTRVGVYGEEGQREWLYRKGEACGFRVLDCRVLNRRFQISRRPNGSPFLAALESGIGSGKAFGFGLLSVARA